MVDDQPLVRSGFRALLNLEDDIEVVAEAAPLVFGAGALVGGLGGMIELGGAEFRLPLLIGMFGFAVLSAVIVNKAMSLVVVVTALPARLAAVSFGELGAQGSIAVDLLAGSLLGAWAGASWAVRMRSATLYKVLAILMVGMAAARRHGHHRRGIARSAGPPFR
ncbi:TSUP family transporter [Streptomyces sp. NPDC058619]|uniref:TSUP family transporter n=1 Tax=unclassified Streptomyces TaxID=2593676 RepID=UPI003656EBD8